MDAAKVLLLQGLARGIARVTLVVYVVNSESSLTGQMAQDELFGPTPHLLQIIQAEGSPT